MTAETFRWAYSTLENAPFTVNDSLELGHDLVARVNIQKHQQASGLTVVSFLTLLIIPTYFEYTLEASVDILDKDNNLVRRYRRSSGYNSWFGWVFMVWGPIVSNMNADAEVFTDLFRGIVTEMYENDYEFYRGYSKE